MNKSVTTESYPSWLGRKALTIAATLGMTAILTATGATLKTVVQAGEISKQNQVELAKRSEWMEAQTEAVAILSENQRLIICQMKKADGMPCTANDLFLNHPD